MIEPTPQMIESRAARSRARAITQMFWDNFLKTERALVMENVIANAIQAAEERGEKRAMEAKRVKPDPTQIEEALKEFSPSHNPDDGSSAW